MGHLINTDTHKKRKKKKKSILIFNCSHERHDPICILSNIQKTLLQYSNILIIYFCYADSERPSMISKPTTIQLLSKEKHVLNNNDNDINDKKYYNDSTWQNTLSNIWKELMIQNNITNRHDIITDLSVSEAFKDIEMKYCCSSSSFDNDEIIHVCITGSLYISGSALNISKWKEDYYMDGYL